MPTYEYACSACGQHVEVVQSMSDAPLQSCGACGGPLRKVFSPIGIVFKGSGFYKTDSRSSDTARSGKKPAASNEKGSTAEKPAETSTEKSGEKKTEKTEKTA